MTVGGIETGGTFTRVAIGAEDGTIATREQFETADPATTVARAAEFFADRRVKAVGVAAFGPLGLDPAWSSKYGKLLKTPKPGWSGFPLRSELERKLSVPVRIETDVNAAALAEQRAAKVEGVDAGTLVYVTVGTGIGVGVAIDGRAHHGALHPEAGHLIVVRRPRAAGEATDDAFQGTCPFHRDCLEGLASATALTARGGPPEKIPTNHGIWEDEAWYLAQLVVAIVGFLAPHRIVLGGGVMKARGLIERVRVRASELAGGYTHLLADAEHLDWYIVPPRLGDHSGLRGALQIAMP